MSGVGLIISLVLLTAVVVWVLMPLLRPAPVQSAAVLLRDKQRERLTAYYERTLRNLHDLDEDHALGKLDTDAYAVDREFWVQRGVAALKALDALDGQSRPPAADPSPLDALPVPTLAATPADIDAVDSAIDDAIEAAVARYREQERG